MQKQVGSTHGRTGNVREILERVDSLEELDEVDFEDDAEGADVRLSDDDVFEILSNPLRRDLLSYLQEQDGVSTVSDIAEHLAAKENDTTVQQLSSYERKRVYIGLYQNHLPKMNDLGVVDYDKNRGTVRLRDCVTQLEPYLQDVDSSTTSRIQIGGSVVLAALIFFGIFDVGAFAVVPDLLWIALGVAGLFGYTALAAYDDF